MKKSGIIIFLFILGIGSLQALDQQYLIEIQSDTTDPSVAFIDGQLAGLLPLKEKVSEGNHTIRVASEGYYDYTASFEVNEPQSLMASLQKVEHRISIEANITDAAVFLDGNLEGTAPLLISAEPGLHRIKLTRPGFADFIRSIDVQDDLNLTAVMESSKVLIYINIPLEYRSEQSEPVLIFLDDILQEERTIEASSGFHSIRIESGALKMESIYDFIAGGSYRISPFMQLRITQ